MKNANEIIIGKPVKISHVLIGATTIVILSLFVTGFGYLPWWVFLIVLILGIFITLPTCFNSYWRINKEEVKLTSYSNNNAIKLMQLLGLHKKDEQIIKLPNIENAEIIYKKNIRISPVDFNPDYLNLYLKTKDGNNYTLSLRNIDYQKLDIIIHFLKDNQIELIDKQGIVQLLNENKNLFAHFHNKKWTAV
ncbi:hypothetical protein CBF56_05605 [Lactobacillus taiwanensis]|uniref:hypothetical protein n=1 Tax=Lactobacillus taiwanensis TaxID=508451 RepID=UPI000B97EA88|nr:hypothetical protein [Lactobacillus taiwanensis]OYR94784.1 hypothetical protein CBF51_09310 [Lactobacillus taiwanensis]OYR99349.1 hypothetical protein CBF61_09175 [Lactobacillus taiwanensis]OYS12430.1 hypothetical protein CBF69_10420 [Lactobacillus taiwanensis]OYS18298.1 hypothetical protein CBF56_05605 [Lactobacillus taiwanensis]OYS39697.1 hypothetical protein CBF79_00325 [Lactobacillus taiwanensis]